MIKKTIGIIGCGAIGSALSGYAERELGSLVAKIFLFDVEEKKAKDLSEKLSGSEIVSSMEELIDKVDLVIETAIGKIVPDVLRMVIDKKKDLIILSIGGILGHEELLFEAREKGINIFLPSGAIAGIDALKASKIAGLENVTITTRKPPLSLKGAPYLVENNIDVEEITEETVVFEGNAIEAIKGFPKNVNVSVLLSLVGEGAEKTNVRIIVSPEFTKNSHEIKITAVAGIITTKTENVSFPENPKTSYLAALSAMAVLKGYFDTVRMGA